MLPLVLTSKLAILDSFEILSFLPVLIPCVFCRYTLAPSLVVAAEDHAWLEKRRECVIDQKNNSSAITSPQVTPSFTLIRYSFAYGKERLVLEGV